MKSLVRLLVTCVAIALVGVGVLQYLGILNIANDGSVQVQAFSGPAKPGFATGDKLFFESKYPEAIDAYKQAIDASPSSPDAADAAFQIGKCYEAMGDTAKATQAFQVVTTKYPSLPLAAKAQERIDYLQAQSGR